MAQIIQQRGDTHARWTEINPIIAQKEMILVDSNGDGDYNQYKVGDGIKRYNELPVRGLPAVSDLTDSTIDVPSTKLLKTQLDMRVKKDEMLIVSETNPTTPPTLNGQFHYNQAEERMFVAASGNASPLTQQVEGRSLLGTAPASWKIRYDQDSGKVSSFEQMEGSPLMRASAEHVTDLSELEVVYNGVIPEDREGYDKTLFYGVVPNDAEVSTLEIRYPTLYATYEATGWVEVATHVNLPIFSYFMEYISHIPNMLQKVPVNIRRRLMEVTYIEENVTVTLKRVGEYDGTHDSWIDVSMWERQPSVDEIKAVESLLPTYGDSTTLMSESCSSVYYDPAQIKLSFPANLVGSPKSHIIDFTSVDVFALKRLALNPELPLTVDVFVVLENISLIKPVLVFVTASGVQTSKSMNLVEFNGCLNIVKYSATLLDIPLDLNLMKVVIYGNVISDVSKPSSIEVLKLRTYSKSPLKSYSMKNGDTLYNRVPCMLRNVDTNHYTQTSSVKGLITIPKDTVIGSRSIVIPIESLALPSLNTKWDILEVRFVGNSVLSDMIDFFEVGPGPGTGIVTTTRLEFKSPETIRFFVKPKAVVNTTQNQSIYMGARTAITIKEDIIVEVEVNILYYKTPILSTNTCRNIENAIGGYLVKGKSPAVGIFDYDKKEGVSVTKSTITFEPSISELGTSVNFVISYSNLFSAHLDNKVEVESFFTVNRFSVADFSLEASVYNLDGATKLVDAAVELGNLYNGNISVKFTISPSTLNTREVLLKLKFTSKSSGGLILTLYDSAFVGVKVNEPIGQRLAVLEGIVPLRLKSPDGSVYTLKVSNSGILSAAKLSISKMLIMAHSWGFIPSSPPTGWYGNWGLAASAQHLDMVQQIKTEGLAVIPDFNTEFFGFAIFATKFKEGASWFENFVCETLEFDSIFILSFVAGPLDGDWTGFGQALYTCITQYTCRGKNDVKIYLANSGAPEAELAIAATLFGTTLIDVSEATSMDGTAWPWAMPKAPGNVTIKKVPPSEPANWETMNGQTLGHPGNWGFYTVAKKVINNVCLDFNIENPSPTIKTFSQYKLLPGIAQYIDPLYPYI